MSIYLIDCENIRIEDLSLLSPQWKRRDKIIMVYSEKVKNTPVSIMDSFSKSGIRIEYLHVNVGTSNALDFQLVSYLGYLIRRHRGKSFTIISNDKGYDCVVTFWEERGVSIARVPVGLPPVHLAKIEKPKAQKAARQAIPKIPKQQNTQVSVKSQKPSQNKSHLSLEAEARTKLSSLLPDSAQCEEAVHLALSARTKSEAANRLNKLLRNSKLVSAVLKVLRPYIKDKPGI